MLGRELLFALIGTGATFLATALGAAMVFLFRKDMSPKLQQIFLGFAAGVMTAAAVFSLLMPAIETLEEQGKNVLLPVGGGFALGALFVNLVGTENGIGKHENVVVLNLHYPRRYRRLLLLLAGNAEGEFAGDERRYGVAVPRHYAVLPVYGGNDEALALALVKGTVGT